MTADQTPLTDEGPASDRDKEDMIAARREVQAVLDGRLPMDNAAYSAAIVMVLWKSGWRPRHLSTSMDRCDIADGWWRLGQKWRQKYNEAQSEVDRLHTWEGLMSLLDKHYPEDILLTEEDAASTEEDRDAGPRIVSLLRWVDRLRAELSGAVADRDRADRQIRVHLDIARAAERDRDGAREVAADAIADLDRANEVARSWEATAAQHYLRLVEYREERDALAAKLDAVREIEPTLRRIVGNGTRSEIELIDAVEVLVSQALDAAPETTRAPSEATTGATGTPDPYPSVGTGVEGPHARPETAEEWQVRVTADDGTGFVIPSDVESAHRTADQWRASLASADVGYCVDAERRFVGAWEQVEEWSHFALYGSVAAVCGEPVPSGTPWEKDRGDWALARFTTRSAETTCPKCRRILGYGRQEGLADEVPDVDGWVAYSATCEACRARSTEEDTE